MPQDIQDEIESAAQEPAEVTSDGVKVVARPLPELIEADKYLSGRTATATPHRGLGFTKLVPPGTV